MKIGRGSLLFLAVLGIGIVCGASLRLTFAGGTAPSGWSTGSRSDRPIDDADRLHRLESRFGQAKRACRASPSPRDAELLASLENALREQLANQLQTPVTGECFQGECRLHVQLDIVDEASRREAINSLYHHPVLGSVDYSLASSERSAVVWHEFSVYVHAPG